MGTAMYMSPEQIHETRSVTPRSDIYSLGVVLWQMVTGKKPYSTETLSAFQLLVACEEGEYATASPLLNKVQSCIDKNVKRGLMHKNTASRKKSQLTFKVKALEPGASAPEPVAA